MWPVTSSSRLQHHQRPKKNKYYLYKQDMLDKQLPKLQKWQEAAGFQYSSAVLERPSLAQNIWQTFCQVGIMKD